VISYSSIDHLSTHIPGGSKKSFYIQQPERHFCAACDAITVHDQTLIRLLHVALQESKNLPSDTPVGLNVEWHSIYSI
jgi:hypothetical protein